MTHADNTTPSSPSAYPGNSLTARVSFETSSDEYGPPVVAVDPSRFHLEHIAGQVDQALRIFDYAVNEALFLLEDEERTLNGIIENIEKEYQSNIDTFSQGIIVSQIETLLNYSERFYQRQFITRGKANHQILERLGKLLTDYFNSDDLIRKRLPTVQYMAEELNVSPGYLRSLLRVLTGQNTQQHIHGKLIEKAKEQLSTTSLSVGEIV